MSRESDDEFYVGWSAENPPRVRRFVRLWVVVLVLLSGGLAFLLARLQAELDPGFFDFGETSRAEGVLLTEPWPTLVPIDPKAPSRLLVELGKHGAQHRVTEPGAVVEAAGTRISGGGALTHTEMLELVAENALTATGTTLDTDALRARLRSESHGEVELVGEIIDTKCYLGVMKPGRGKPHRACASLCLRGGIPAALLVRDRERRSAVLLLADEEGRGLGGERVLELVAEPVRARGELVHQAGQWQLRVGDTGLRRLDPP